MQRLLSSVSVWHLKEAYHETLHEVLGHIKIVQRLERAYKILTESSEYSIEMIMSMPIVFIVTSPNGQYTVTPALHECTCPDAETLCKHRLAVKMIVRALEFQQEDAA